MKTCATSSAKNGEPTESVESFFRELDQVKTEAEKPEGRTGEKPKEVRPNHLDDQLLPAQVADIPALEERLDLEATAENHPAEDLATLLPLESDPLAEADQGPLENWLQEIARIEPRRLEVLDAQQQESAIEQVHFEIEREPHEPDAQTILDTEQAIEKLKGSIPDANQFVAGSF